MRKEKMFEMIVDLGDSIIKVKRTATTEKELRAIYQGNGEIIRVKDVTKDSPLSRVSIRNALSYAQFGDNEIEVITALVDKYYENTIA